VNERQAPHKLVELLEISVLHQHHLYLCRDEASLRAFKSKENGMVRQIAENGNRSVNISMSTTLMVLRIQHNINHIAIALFI
jgi:hypothetical protein